MTPSKLERDFILDTDHFAVDSGRIVHLKLFFGGDPGEPDTWEHDTAFIGRVIGCDYHEFKFAKFSPLTRHFYHEIVEIEAAMADLDECRTDGYESMRDEVRRGFEAGISGGLRTA